jgi:hypothetical protein
VQRYFSNNAYGGGSVAQAAVNIVANMDGKAMRMTALSIFDMP